MNKRPSISIIPAICVLLFFASFYSYAQVVKDTLLASQYFKKADSLFIEQKFESSIELFKKALPIYKKEKVWEKVVNCYNRISEAQKYNTEYDQSKESATTALEICKRYLKSNHRQEAHANDNIGHYYELSVSDFKTASEYFNKAFEIRKKIFPENHEDIALSYDKLGLLFLRKGMITIALENYEKCFDIRKKIFDKDHIEIATSYQRFALIFRFQGEYEKALLYYNKELEIRIKRYGKDHISLALPYRGLADIYMTLSEYKKAETLLKKALAIRMNSNAGRRENLGYLYETLGNLYESMGKYDASISYYKKSLALLIELFGEDGLNVADIYYGLGLLYGRMGFSDKELQNKYKALKIYLDKSKNHFNLGIIYNGIGVSFKHAGNYEKALQFYKKSRDLAIEKFGKDHYLVGTANTNIGYIYIINEDYHKALELFKTSLSIDRNSVGEKHEKIATNYISFGDIYLAKKQYTKAADYYLKALAIQQSVLGNGHNNIASLFDKLGSLYQENKKFDVAMNYFDKALAIRKKIYSEPNQFIADSYEQIAQLYVDTKAYQNALLTFKKAEKSNTKNTIDTLSVNSFISNSLDVNQLLRITNDKAKTYVALYEQDANIKNLGNAIVAYQQADVLINHIKKTHSNYKDKITFSKKAKEVYQGAITAQLLVYKNQKDAKSLERTFYYAEKSKANTLKELLNDANAKDFTGLPSTVVVLEKELKIKKAFYQSQINTELSSTSKDSTKLAHYESKLFDIVRRQDSLTAILEKNYPKYYELKYKDELITVSEIQQQLDDKTTVLEFFTTDSISYAFTISKNDINVHELSTPKLTGHIETFRNGIISQNIKTYTQKAHALYQSLIAPVKKNIIGDKLIIIPDNSLWHLNFELLLTQKPDSDNFATMPYMLGEYAITYANSANLLFSKFKPKESVDTLKECLAFSFSDSTYTINTSATRFASLRGTADDLPGTREEIRAISNIIDGQYYYGSQAIETNFKKNAGQYNILHLALHGEVDNERPENSKLYFTKSNDTLEDNLLYSHELFALDIPAELTVLSACNTGTGKIAKGEGIMSLGNAFQYAGTKSLLLTSWEASDKTTPVLMKNFYTNLKEGMNKGEALQQAKLQYLQTANFNEANPFYWGGFYLLGDSTPMHFDTNTPWYWVVGFLSLILIVGLVFIRKRKKKSV